MIKQSVFLAALSALLLAMPGIAQPSLSTPEMSVQSFEEIGVRDMADGRKVFRASAATVGLVYVEWPKGSVTTPHNHANELILTVMSGRLRAMSGDSEFIMEAGDVVTIPAWVDHSYEALEDTTTMEAAGPG